MACLGPPTVSLGCSKKKNRDAARIELHGDLEARLAVEQDNTQELRGRVVRVPPEAVTVKMLGIVPLGVRNEVVVERAEVMSQEL